MKLICEVVESVKVLKEAREDGKKEYYIEGIFLQGDIKNRNGRMYPSSILESEVGRYSKMYIEQNRAYGELGHPDGPSINLDRVSHMIKSLHREGANFIGRAKITDTPMGNIVKNLIDEGANLGVSSRGMGTLKQTNEGFMVVQDDFMLSTAADIVADPSAPDAFVRGVMEGVEWVYDVGSGNWRAMQELDKMKKQISESTVKQVNAAKFHMFERYLNTLITK